MNNKHFAFNLKYQILISPRRGIYLQKQYILENLLQF